MATFRLCTDPPRSTHRTPYGLQVKLFPVKWCFTVTSEGGIWNPDLSVTSRNASASLTFRSNTFRGSSNTWQRHAWVSSYISNGTLTLAHSGKEKSKESMLVMSNITIFIMSTWPGHDCIVTGSQIRSNFTEKQSALPVLTIRGRQRTFIDIIR